MDWLDFRIKINWKGKGKSESEECLLIAAASIVLHKLRDSLKANNLKYQFPSYSQCIILTNSHKHRLHFFRSISLLQANEIVLFIERCHRERINRSYSSETINNLKHHWSKARTYNIDILNPDSFIDASRWLLGHIESWT